MHDEDFDYIDELIESIGEAIEWDESRTMMLDPIRVKQMQFVYAVLSKFADGSDIHLSYKFNEPYTSMGSVSIEGEDLTLHETMWLARAVQFASNVDIYPLTDNKLRMTFTFHSLTVPID